MATKFKTGAELLCSVDAAYMDNRFAGVTVAIILLILTLQGILGVGRLGIWTINSVFAAIFALIDIYILRFVTEEIGVKVVDPNDTIILRARLLRLSN